MLFVSNLFFIIFGSAETQPWNSIRKGNQIYKILINFHYTNFIRPSSLIEIINQLINLLISIKHYSSYREYYFLNCIVLQVFMNVFISCRLLKSIEHFRIFKSKLSLFQLFDYWNIFNLIEIMISKIQ